MSHQNPQHPQQRAPPQMPRGQFAHTNRVPNQAYDIARRDRLAGVISTEEWEQTVEKHDESGRGFRVFFYSMILFFIGLLVYMKYDVEVGVEIPERLLKLTAQEMGDKKVQAETATAEEQEERKRLEEYYKTLNVDGRLKTVVGEAVKAGDAEASTTAKPTATDDSAEKDDSSAEEGVVEKEGTDDADEKKSDESTEQQLDREARERRKQERIDRQLANWRLRQEMKKKYESHVEQYGQLVTCGKECKANHDNMQVAFDTLSAQVDRDLYSVLLDDAIKVNDDGSVKQTRKRVDVDELKEKTEEKIKDVMASTEENSEVREMQLAEIKDAYDILIDNDARTYYHMYGLKPPAYMKKQSARHGGWGQELLLKTFKNRLVMEWLNAADASWADWSVLGVIGFVGFLLPVLVQLPKIWEMANEMEKRWDEMAALEKEMKERQGRAARGPQPAQ